MGEKELTDMILSERINQLLGQEKDAENDLGADQEDEILQGMEDGRRIKIEAYINQLIEVSAEHERHIYLGGFCDGVRLALRICRIGGRELFGEYEAGGEAADTKKYNGRQ